MSTATNNTFFRLGRIYDTLTQNHRQKVVKWGGFTFVWGGFKFVQGSLIFNFDKNFIDL